MVGNGIALPSARVVAQVVTQAGAWDQSIERLEGSLLQGWRWGELKSRHGWSPIRLLLTGGDQPLLAAQILFRRFGPLSVAYVPRGPAVTDSTPATTAMLTMALDHVCKRRNAAIVFVEPDQGSLPFPTGGTLGWSPSQAMFQPKRTIKVRVDQPDDALLQQMKPKTRYNVRLAERRGVTVRMGTLADVPGVYRLLRETAERNAFGIHSLEYYQDVLKTFGPDAALFVAELDGDLAAAVVAIRQQREAVYMYGASTAQHQRHMPAYLIQFEAMRWARESGCVWYDFWGIPDSDLPPAEAEDGNGKQLNVRNGLWGTYRFKQGFGGDVMSYPGVFERVYLRPAVELWRRFRPGLG